MSLFIWTEAIKKHSSDSSDYCKVLSSAYLVTEKALQDTPNQLEILKEAGVVDAGAQGFVSLALILKVLNNSRLGYLKVLDLAESKINLESENKKRKRINLLYNS